MIMLTRANFVIMCFMARHVSNKGGAMAKKYTLTVPEDLSVKIDTWRGKINLSEVFREAVAAIIADREDFRKRLPI